jgi:DNA-3-methyladenine glycosylase II
LKIDFKPPLYLRASLAPLGRWGDDGIDRWDGTTLARTAPLVDAALVPYSAVIGGDRDQPSLKVTVGGAFSAPQRQALTAAVRASFVRVPAELPSLAAADARVARLVELYPGVVPVLFPDPFVALIRSISAQQVNLRWAATVRRRIAERYGMRHEIGDTFVYALDPEPLANASVAELRALQLTNAKARSVIAVAHAAQAGELKRADLERMDDEILIAHLTRIRGIGRWSAEWFLARTLGRARVVAGDLGVRKAVGRMCRAGSLPTELEVRRLTAHWGESATIVQALALYDVAGAPPAA